MKWRPYSRYMQAVKSKLAQGPATTHELLDVAREATPMQLYHSLYHAKKSGHIRIEKEEKIDRKSLGLGGGYNKLTTWVIA